MHDYLLQYAARDASTLQRSMGQLAETEALFRPLSAAERQAARPWNVRTVALPPGGFAELARHSPLTALAEQQLRLMNGWYGKRGNLPAGAKVKVVQ